MPANQYLCVSWFLTQTRSQWDVWVAASLFDIFSAGYYLLSGHTYSSEAQMSSEVSVDMNHYMTPWPQRLSLSLLVHFWRRIFGSAYIIEALRNSLSTAHPLPCLEWHKDVNPTAARTSNPVKTNSLDCDLGSYSTHHRVFQFFVLFTPTAVPNVFCNFQFKS